jgi:bacterioferritin (cytochrome b1)
MTEERMDVEAQVDALNAALGPQRRSALQYSLVAASAIGLEYQAYSDKLLAFAHAELDDSNRIAEKIVALGGQPTTEVAPLAWDAEPADAFDRLIGFETEALEKLQAAIEPTGREAASEAIEHRLEHIIMRKQEQVDYLLRARRRPGSA